MVKLDADIKAIARSIIQGNEKRKKRIKNGQASAFDLQAAQVVDNALRGTCGKIESVRVRRQMQEKIYKSIVYNMPYEYIADALCGRRQFYETGSVRHGYATGAERAGTWEWELI